MAEPAAGGLDQATSWLYAGTHRSGPRTGISRARFDPAGGALSAFTLAAESADPAFLVVHRDGRHLYACNSGTPGGVSAFALDPASGDLRYLNHVVSEGRGPSQLSLDHTGRHVLDANYGGGYAEVLALDQDGRLGSRTAFVRHTGHSVDPVRQTQPYAHCIRVGPANRFAFVADLGLDQVLIYRFDAATGSLTPHDPAYAAVTPGSGPRHLAWHPNGRWLYLIEEMSSTVVVFAWDSATSRLHARQTVSTLPRGFTGESIAAEILVHGSGRWLYASNRGHDSIAVFAIDPGTGVLTPVAHAGSRGRTPRYMTFDCTERWLLVANIDSETVAIFGLDADTGQLTPQGEPHAAPRPYGLAMARAAQTS
jgi:6-phosphogluconolactonase